MILIDKVLGINHTNVELKCQRQYGKVAFQRRGLIIPMWN